MRLEDYLSGVAKVFTLCTCVKIQILCEKILW